MAARRRIFNSVFPVESEKSIPTPTATPVLGAGSFGGSFVATQRASSDPDDAATKKVQHQRAWHSATAFLSTPEASITFHEACRDDKALRNKWIKPCSREVASAIAYLASEEAVKQTLAAKPKEESLLDWYLQEIIRHYVEYQVPVLTKILAQDVQYEALSEALKVLQVSQAIYFHPYKQHVLPSIHSEDEKEPERFTDSFHAIVSTSLARGHFMRHLAAFLRVQGSIVLEIDSPEEENEMAIDSSSGMDARTKIRDAMISADEVGLGGAQSERVFAETMNELLVAYVHDTYAGQVTNTDKGPDSLIKWINSRWSPFVAEIVACLYGDDQKSERVQRIAASDIENWQARAIHELATLRLREAFDIVVDWQSSSKPGLSDLSSIIKTTAGRAYVTSQFSASVSNRLLQPGASTIEILQVYIHIIMAFLELDPRGVLLDRVSRPIRRYLRERDDTVRIIIQGLLIDPTADTEPASEPLSELARVMVDLRNNYDAEDELDTELYSLQWTPDPVDAAPEYKGDESGEMIASLIDIFDNKDVFVKEFQNMLSESLLRGEYDFYKEIHVLELFKKRLGESLLQSCEVMLKDLSDSRRIDDYIKKEHNVEEGDTIYTTKILSRLYWPPLQSEPFVPPPDVEIFQKQYESAFEQYKNSRKLDWLNSLGAAKVELELEDRTVEVDCHTWQANVIYQFDQEEDEKENGPASKSLEDVVSLTKMDEDLVQAALTFWVGKMVLHESKPGVYTVLEKLPPTTAVGSSSETNTGSGALAAAAAAASASAAAIESASSAVRSEEDLVEEKMAVFWQFIVGMLTNQGQMPLQRIVMMLKFVVPGGFAYGNDDLRTFLSSRIREGKLELSGGNYRIIKGAA